MSGLEIAAEKKSVVTLKEAAYSCLHVLLQLIMFAAKYCVNLH